MRRTALVPVAVAVMVSGAGCTPVRVSRPEERAPVAAPRVPALSRDTAVARELGAGVTVRRLAPGVWMHTSRGAFGGASNVASNGLIVEGEGETLLIDTAWDDAQTDTILRWAAAALRHPVRRAVITHAHDDRLGGLGALERAGIAAVSAPLTRERALAMADSGRPARAPRALEQLRALGAALPHGEIILLNPGGGHAPDNIVVWIPASRVLFGGCFVRALATSSLGFTGDAELDTWPRSVERVRQAFPGAAIVVPGHGEPGDARLLEHTAELLRRRAAGGG